MTSDDAKGIRHTGTLLCVCVCVWGGGIGWNAIANDDARGDLWSAKTQWHHLRTFPYVYLWDSNRSSYFPRRSKAPPGSRTNQERRCRVFKRIFLKISGVLKEFCVFRFFKGEKNFATIILIVSSSFKNPAPLQLRVVMSMAGAGGRPFRVHFELWDYTANKVH